MINKSFALTAALLAATITNAGAAIAVNTQTSGTNTAFDGNISSTDLINTGQSTLQSANYSFSGTFGGSTGAHDGLAGSNANIYYQNSAAMKSVGFVFMTFDLNTSVNTLGYDITSIATTYGFGSTWADQIYDVEYTTVSNATPVALTSVDFTPGGTAASSRVVLTDDSGVLASGVNSIRFKLYSNPDKGNDVGIARELDVFGDATVAVPEPSSFGLLAGMFGLTWVMLRRRA